MQFLRAREAGRVDTGEYAARVNGLIGRGARLLR
jgi:hypothetical protein